MLLLLRMYPEAQVDVGEQEVWREAKDWSASVRPLQIFDEETTKLPWISLQRDQLGDQLSPDYTKYDREHLNEYPEQRFAYEIIRQHAARTFAAIADDEPSPLPLLMIIDGAGGCGKSHVLHCSVKELLQLAILYHYQGKPVEVAAPTGAAASLVFGGTLHSFIRWNPSYPFEEFFQGSETN